MIQTSKTSSSEATGSSAVLHAMGPNFADTCHKTLLTSNRLESQGGKIEIWTADGRSKKPGPKNEQLSVFSV